METTEQVLSNQFKSAIEFLNLPYDRKIQIVYNSIKDKNGMKHSELIARTNNFTNFLKKVILK